MKPEDIKIITFAQLRNERRKGNLENWFKCINSFSDYIYIFDQASDDNSQELYFQLGGDKVRLYQSDKNNFHNEVGCKSLLLNELLRKEPDTTWIFWGDGDEVYDKRILDHTKIREMLALYDDVDGLNMGFYNLWRSDTHYRLDNSYHGLHGGCCSFWRVNKHLYFPRQGGLHSIVKPIGVDNVVKIDQRTGEYYSKIHRGFAETYQIMLKYDVYKARGQRGNDLERLLDEHTLETGEVPNEVLPDWYKIRENNNPHTRKPIREIYNEVKKTFGLNYNLEYIDRYNINEIINKYE